MPEFQCVKCQSPYPASGVPYACPVCGGMFDYPAPLKIDLNKVEKDLPGMWRYRHSFVLPKNAPVVSLGEGQTPLLWQKHKGFEVGLKLESMNPTGSYKDRGTAVLLSQLAARGVDLAVEDSSGNAGASFAAYAARAGMRARVFVPETASGPKRHQIEMFGADLVRVPGPRSEAAKAVLAEAERGIAYASHAFMPFGLPGIATTAYEIFEQMGTVPGTVICPVGHGGLLLGLIRGFSALEYAGFAERQPYYVGVQAQNCAPLWAVYQKGKTALAQFEEGPTLAEGVRVRQPSRMDAILVEIGTQGGIITAVSEEDLLPAARELARYGVYVEPTSALVWAAWKDLMEELPGPIVMVLTGSGLKTNTPL